MNYAIEILQRQIRAERIALRFECDRVEAEALCWRIEALEEAIQLLTGSENR